MLQRDDLRSAKKNISWRLSLRFWQEGVWIRLLAVALFVLLLEISAVPLSQQRPLQRARRAYELLDYDGAAEAYHRVYKYLPWETGYLAAAAEAEMQAGNYSDAERDLGRLAERRPLTAQETVWLGAIYAGQGRIDEAVAAWEYARTLGAVDADSLVQLAQVYIARREWDQARAALEGLAGYASTDARIYYQLGLIQALDRPEQAAISLAQAVTLDPSQARRLAPLRASLTTRANEPRDLAYARLGILYLSLNELPLSEEALSRAYAYNPAYGEALAYLAFVRAQLGKPALGAAQQALALSPSSPTVHYLAGLTWKELDCFFEARVEFELAYDLDPTNPAFAVEIASTHRAEGAFEWAEIWMQEAVRLAPDDMRFQILLVQFYVDENYQVNETGLPLAQNLVERFPNSALAHDALGWAYYLTDDLERASAELKTALVLDPDLARVHLHFAVVLESQGRMPEAILHYQEASRLEPSGLFGTLARRALERIGGL